MKNICELCKHWKHNEREFGIKGYGTCSCSKFYDAYEYHRPFMVRNSEFPLDGLVTFGGQSEASWFQTGPKFKCIHWRKQYG